MPVSAAAAARNTAAAANCRPPCEDTSGCSLSGLQPTPAALLAVYLTYSAPSHDADSPHQVMAASKNQCRLPAVFWVSKVLHAQQARHL